MRTVWMQLRRTRAAAMTAVAIAAMLMPLALMAQAPPHQSGTVKAKSDGGLTLTTAAGQEYAVAVPAGAKVLVVPPGASAKDAVAGTLDDVAVGDKAIVLGTAGDVGTSLTATKVYLLKAAAIAQSHAAAEEGWAQGVGGIVKSVEVSGGKVVLASGMKTVTVVVTPSTVVRHYSGGSVSFADAKRCPLGDVKPGDQLRVRGAKAADGLTVTADEMVAGTFHNFSGLLTAVDAAAGTVTLKDLVTKRSVTVSVTPSSNVRRLAPQMAMGIAARMKGAAAGGGAPHGAAAPPASGASSAAGASYGAGAFRGAGAAQGGGRGGADLSQMLARLPTETVAGLKPGEAVMIVASSPADDEGKSAAVTLVVGVEPLLTALPAGEMTLSPWNLGGGGMEGAGGGR